jgi:transposase
MNKKYIVKLTKQERNMLGEVVRKGTSPAYKIKHANILLQVDQRGRGGKDEEVAQSLGCHLNTVRNVRERFVKEGLEMALERKKQEEPSRSRLLDGKKEAHLIALGCSQPPKGFARWTLQLLTDKLVSLEMIESISLETVRRTLKKTNLSLT